MHVTAAYWSLYRVARNYPNIALTQPWSWYLNQAFQTVLAMTNGQVGYAGDGLMDETVFLYLLSDLQREGLTANATAMESKMKARYSVWATERFPWVFMISGICSIIHVIIDLVLRWLGIRQVKRASMHGASSSTIRQLLSMLLILSSRISRRSRIGATTGMHGDTGEAKPCPKLDLL